MLQPRWSIHILHGEHSPDSSTPLGQRCIMVASVAVAFPLHQSVGPTLYNGWYTVAVAFPSHHSVGPTLYDGCYGRGCIAVT